MEGIYQYLFNLMGNGLFSVFPTINICIFLTTVIPIILFPVCSLNIYFVVVHGVGLFNTVKSAFHCVLWYLLKFP